MRNGRVLKRELLRSQENRSILRRARECVRVAEQFDEIVLEPVADLLVQRTIDEHI